MRHSIQVEVGERAASRRVDEQLLGERAGGDVGLVAVGEHARQAALAAHAHAHRAAAALRRREWEGEMRRGGGAWCGCGCVGVACGKEARARAGVACGSVHLLRVGQRVQVDAPLGEHRHKVGVEPHRLDGAEVLALGHLRRGEARGEERVGERRGGESRGEMMRRGEVRGVAWCVVWHAGAPASALSACGGWRAPAGSPYR